MFQNSSESLSSSIKKVYHKKQIFAEVTKNIGIATLLEKKLLPILKVSKKVW